MSDDDLLALWQLVTQGVARTQHRVSEEIEDAGVPAQWFAALHLLINAPGRRLPMSRLARDLTMTSGGFTKLADRMARDGLIDRRGSSDDRRVVYATLTEQGVRTAKRVTGLYVKALREHLLGVIPEPDLAMMSQVARVLSEHHATAPEDDEASGLHQAGLPGTAASGDSASGADGAGPRNGRDPALPDRRGRGRATS